MTVILITVAILLSAIAATSLTIAADRIARATAWRQIAQERRWRDCQTNGVTVVR